MIPGKLYADAPMVFKAYLYAKKITIIPDFVYYWRKRSTTAITKGNSYTSITKSLLDLDNMHDRLVTYYYLKDYFKEAGKEDLFNNVMKIYFERFFYPINGILEDEEFKKGYLKELKPILEDIPDIFNNNLRKVYNLYAYFILNDQIKALEEFINFYKDEKNTIEENGKLYWNLKYFRNPEYNIPDELFEIDYIDNKNIKIGNIKSDSKYIYIDDIEIPNNISLDIKEAILIGLTKKDMSRMDDTHRFPLERISENLNKFNVKIPIDSLNINIYDIYLKFKYNGRDELFRIREDDFEKIDKDKLNKSKKVNIYFSSLGNCSVMIANSKNFFKIEADNEKINIYPNSEGDICYKISTNYKKKTERIYFRRMKEDGKFKNGFELKWKYSIDYNIPYTLYLEINKKRFKLTDDYFENFTNQNISYDNGTIKIFKDKDNSISIRYL